VCVHNVIYVDEIPYADSIWVIIIRSKSLERCTRLCCDEYSPGGIGGTNLDRRHVIGWIILILVVTVLGVATAARSLALRCMAKLWIVSDRLDRADAIVVLGGGLDVRPAAAAELYKRAMAPRVAVGISEFDHGLDASLNRGMLLQNGVPASAIVEFGFWPHSTYGEARGILEWARVSGAQSVIIPIDIFQTRRVRWIFNRELGPAHIRPIIQAVTPSSYSADDWWLNELGFTNFRNELIKFIYYRLRY